MKDWYEYLSKPQTKTAGLGPDGELSGVQHQATGMDDFLSGTASVEGDLESLFTDRRASAPRGKQYRVASVEKLKGFTRVASDTLIRHADRDLWSIKEGDDGEFLIERLFDDDGNPIKA
jgi:hypothetical protein